MFGGEVVGALEFNEECVFDEEVGEVVSDGVAFIGDGDGDLAGRLDAAEGEFAVEGAFVDLFEEAGAEGVGNREDGAEDEFSEGVEVSGVHNGEWGVGWARDFLNWINY